MDENDSSGINKPNTSKSCSKCGKIYQNNEISYCYYDGTKLNTIDDSSIVKPVQSSTQKQRKNPFDKIGFELNLKDSSHVSNIPIELIQTTTRLLQPNTKLPQYIENVKSSFLTIPSPKPKRNFLTQPFLHSGFSRVNFFAYFLVLMFVGTTYSLWLYRGMTFYQIGFTDNTYNMLAIVSFVNVLLLIILILPIITLGYAVTDVIQATKDDFRLKIEPSLFIFSIILNYIIFQLNWPLPIIVIPGEPKIRGIPPFNTVAKAIRNGLLPGFFIVLGAFGGLLYINQGLLQVDLFLKLNLEIFLLFSLSMFFLALMPFKNAIGRLIQKENPIIFYTVFMAVFIMLISLLSIIEF